MEELKLKLEFIEKYYLALIQLNIKGLEQIKAKIQ